MKAEELAQKMDMQTGGDAGETAEGEAMREKCCLCGHLVHGPQTIFQALLRVYEDARAEGAELEREACARWWDDTEVRSAEAHAAYQREAHRRGDVRHPDAYDDPSELTKERDRVLVRWVAAAIRARGQGGER